MAGFLTYGSSLEYHLPEFPQWYYDIKLANYSCGYSPGIITVFPIIPSRGTIVWGQL